MPARRDDLLTIAQLLPGPAAPDAGRLFGDDVRARAGAVVPDLDQNPAPRPGARQREATRQLAAVQNEGQVTRFVADKVGGPLIQMITAPVPRRWPS